LFAAPAAPVLRSFLMAPEPNGRPRVGVTWCESRGEKTGRRRAFDRYLRAVREAGGEPVEVSLLLPDAELKRLAQSLDAIVLTGSAADVNPHRFGAARHPKAADPDLHRERTDDLLLDHALAESKPVLGICFGAQILNVHLHGSLVQHIPGEVHGDIGHSRSVRSGYGTHPVRLERGRLAELAGGSTLRANSTHHQAILEPGRGLRVTARAPDGVVEAVEWIGGPQWIVGVQWHPERAPGDALASGLFASLIREAKKSKSRAAR
jgi:putative glutamine amidotransferase